MNHAEWETRRAILVKILTAVRNEWPAPVPAEIHNSDELLIHRVRGKPAVFASMLARVFRTSRRLNLIQLLSLSGQLTKPQ